MAGKHFPQGIWSFNDFDDYRENWIKSNVLTGLETVFEGARMEWMRHPGQIHGRGDFVMGTALFAAFDHIGHFLAPTPDHSFRSFDNISRVAFCLPSLRDVYLIIGNLGRNALVHGGWPQSAFRLPNENWAFGFLVSANISLIEPDHDTLYTRQYPLELGGQPVLILKLIDNVHVLRSELSKWVHTGSALHNVNPDVFTYVQKLSTLSGDPSYPVDRRAKAGVARERPRGETLEAQVMRLYREAASNYFVGENGQQTTILEEVNRGFPRNHPERIHCRMKNM